MLNRFFFHTNSRSETSYAPLINCVIDALLVTMPAIDQALLQFIDVMNLLDQLLYFSPYFIDMCSWVVKGLVK